MKFLITIPASLTHGKKPKVIQPKQYVREAFNEEQIRRNEAVSKMLANGASVQPLSEWIEAIPTI